MSAVQLVLDLASERYRRLLTDIVSSNLKLPDIMHITLDKLEEGDKDARCFLENWISNKKESIYINSKIINNKGIKVDNYLDSISNAIKLASDNVCINWFEINEEGLEKIVKSVFYSTRFSLMFCEIHCSKTLDFIIKEKYRIKQISFNCCGNTGAAEIKTDWKTNPSSFENIVEAISKCGLKYSLEQVSIYGNQTLKKDEVQLLFNKHGMPHIDVIDDQ